MKHTWRTQLGQITASFGLWKKLQ